jgi:hypothetical protein
MCYAHKPDASGPIFLERDKGYPTWTGAVGFQFEKLALDHSSEFNRCYDISTVCFGPHRLLYSGEIDAVDAADRTLELKTRPVDTEVNARIQDAWLQGFVSGTERVIMCEYEKNTERIVFDPAKHPPVIIDVAQEADRDTVIAFQFKQSSFQTLHKILTLMHSVVQSGPFVYRCVFHPEVGMSISQLLNAGYASTLFPSATQLRRCLDAGLAPEPPSAELSHVWNCVSSD